MAALVPVLVSLWSTMSMSGSGTVAAVRDLLAQIREVIEHQTAAVRRFMDDDYQRTGFTSAQFKEVVDRADGQLRRYLQVCARQCRVR